MRREPPKRTVAAYGRSTTLMPSRAAMIANGLLDVGELQQRVVRCLAGNSGWASRATAF